jgi:hypothetical protein
MTKRQALRVLIHLVGDLHQPLHVSSGYYDFGPQDEAILLTDPVKAKGRPGDLGGNLLHWGPGRSDELHADWDVVVVEKITGGTDFRALATRLENDARGKSWAGKGDYHTDWAPAWAMEALSSAAPAYADLELGRASFDSHASLVAIDIRQRPDRQTYIQKYSAVAEQQLTRAAGRLTALLNQIKWK